MKQNPSTDKKFIDQQTDRRVHELLLNEKDEVTEQDINNIKTDVTEDEGMVTTEVPLMKAKIKDDSDPETDNSSWNVLEGDN